MRPYEPISNSYTVKNSYTRDSYGLSYSTSAHNAGAATTTFAHHYNGYERSTNYNNGSSFTAHYNNYLEVTKPSNFNEMRHPSSTYDYTYRPGFSSTYHQQ